MRLFFRAHAVSAAFVGVVETGLLNDLAAALERFDVALDFILQRLFDKAERVDVLYFCLSAEFLLSAGPHANVGIAAQGTFLHVAVADAGIENDLLETGEVLVGFVGRAHVGFADDLGERNTGAIQIDRRLVSGIGKTLMQTLARVFFEMQAGNAGFLFATIKIDVNRSKIPKRVVTLPNL